MLEIVLIRHIIPWAGHTNSLAHSSLSFRKIPRIVFCRHRLLTVIVRSSYLIQFKKILWYSFCLLSLSGEIHSLATKAYLKTAYLRFEFN